MKEIDEVWERKFNSKDRLNCANCGLPEFVITETGMPNTTINEAVFLICKNCGHKRLELL